MFWLSKFSLSLPLVISFTVSSLTSFKLNRQTISNELYNLPMNYEVKMFEQKVDHFSYSKNDVFLQRYIISKEHWKPNGPIFFYAGNEADIFLFVNNTGFMWENAKDFKAMVIFMEHRYYGSSMPYGKKSFQDLDHEGYLTVGQSLADFANFLAWIKNEIPGAKQSPVVIFGGSYGGMLASWFRIKYPHLTVGALASSAPILQIPGIYNCESYKQIVTKDFENYSSKCSDSIRNSWEALRRVAKTKQGLNIISEQFVLCTILTEKTLNSFIDWLSDIWETLSMNDYPNPTHFFSPLPAYPIKVVCEHLTEPNADDQTLIKAIARGVSVFTNYTGKTTCNNISANFEMMDGWDFQACTEMVLPVCSDGIQDMFEKKPWDFEKFSQDCKEKYGVGSERYKTLIMFGGDHIKSSSNIIFSNGLRDPWSAGGVLENLSESIIAIKIPGACHHEDLREKGPNDPQALLDARQQELSIIRRWLEKHYKEKQIEFVW